MPTKKHIQVFTRFLKKHNAYCLYIKKTIHKNTEWWLQNRLEEYIISPFMWQYEDQIDWSMLHRKWLSLVRLVKKL